jgi:hypothetical protein
MTYVRRPRRVDSRRVAILDGVPLARTYGYSTE